jgi:N-acetylglucosaminyldiphosphoundecaprenol N-acetyl-beta-D-mannosaminyltransferase
MICENETSLRTFAYSAHRVQIGHALIDSGSFDEMEEAIVRTAALGGEPKYVVTPNAQVVVLLAKDEYLRQIYSEAAFVLPDGVSVLLAARVMGQKIPQRIPGVDMFEALCGRAAREGLRVFLLGGRPGSAEKAAEKLLAKNQGLIVSGTCCPPLGFENDKGQLHDIQSRIRAARPHLLFVAFGTPKQEYWMYENLADLEVPISMAVGGSFEMVGEVVARAPRWLQRIGVEWLYRLVREPRRLWKRYLIGNIQFANIVLRQRMNLLNER